MGQIHQINPEKQTSIPRNATLCSYSSKFRDISLQFNEKHNFNKMEKTKEKQEFSYILYPHDFNIILSLKFEFELLYSYKIYS